MAQPTPTGTDPSPLESARAFLATGLRFATIASIAGDGSPHQAVAWFLFRDDTIILNSADGRAWPANLRRDQRVSVTIEDEYRWLSVRGTVSILDDQSIAQADIAEMARLYHADEPERAETMIRDRFEHQRRVTFHLQLADSRLHFEE